MTAGRQTNAILEEISHWLREIAYAVAVNHVDAYVPVDRPNLAFPSRADYRTDKEFYDAVDAYNGCAMS